MRGDVTIMLVTIFLLSALCGFVQSSGGVGFVAQTAPAPVVTAASSQYFERTFNRLVAVPPPQEPVFPVAPPPSVIPYARNPPFVSISPSPAVVPVAPPPPVLTFQSIPNVIRVAPVSPAIPLLPPRPVFLQPSPPPTEKQDPVAPNNPSESTSFDPNVAIAVATANAAAPVATILLPPYPFGPPPSFGFIPSSPTFAPEEKREKESTTEKAIQNEATTTEKVNDLTTPVPTNIDNNFVQALPSNENVNFKQYLPPQVQLPLASYSPPPTRPQTVKIQHPRPHKGKTTVEVVPVPLTYIAPPPVKKSHPIKLFKIKKHIHTFIPTGKIVIRPASHRVRSVGNHVYGMAYRKPISAKNVAPYPQFISRRSKSRDIEPTTSRPFIRPNNAPTTL